MCVAQQDIWAPEVPGELMREAPAKLSIGGDFCIGRRWVGGVVLFGVRDRAQSAMRKVFHFCCSYFFVCFIFIARNFKLL